MSRSEVVATYRVDSYLPLEQAAEVIAGTKEAGLVSTNLAAEQEAKLREAFAQES